MPRRFNDEKRRAQDGSPDFTRLLFVAFGIALLLGLVTGSIWIGRLFRFHVLP